MQKKATRKITCAQSLLPALIGGLGLYAGAVQASGFQLLEQNASGLGNAYAGSAAVAEDASTVFFNPAGMALLPAEKKHVAVGLNLINPSAKFSDNGSVNPVSPPMSLGANNGGDAGSLAAVPHAYFTMPLTGQISFGVGMGAPFGLKTEYDDSWKGRFLGIKSSVETININPSLSFKLNDTVSLGIGANYQKLKGEFTSAVNYAFVLDQLTSSVPGLAPLAGLAPGAGEGRAVIKGEDTAWGYNLGAMIQPTPATRLGIAYRSATKYHLTGSSSFTPNTNLATLLNTVSTVAGPAAATTLSGRLPTRGGAIYSDIKLPDTLILSGMHRLNGQWDLLADLSWTGWAKIQSLDFKYANDNSMLSSTPERWRNTLRAALGANFRMSPQITLRGGLAYDQTPVAASNRTPRLPDNNRTWLSFGAQYRLAQNSAIDMGYTHLFVGNSSINDAGSNTNNNGVLRGTYKNSVDILGLQYSQSF